MDGDALDAALFAQTVVIPGDERTPAERGLHASRVVEGWKGSKALTAEQASYLLDQQSIVDQQEDEARLAAKTRMDQHEFGNIHEANRARSLAEMMSEESPADGESIDGETDGENADIDPFFNPRTVEEEFGLQPGAASGYVNRAQVVRDMRKWMTELGEADPEVWFNGVHVTDEMRVKWAEIGKKAREEAVAHGSLDPDKDTMRAMRHLAGLAAKGQPGAAIEQIVRRILATPDAKPVQRVRQARESAPKNIHEALQRFPW
jgi:hypothetical protein